MELLNYRSVWTGVRLRDKPFCIIEEGLDEMRLEDNPEIMRCQKPEEGGLFNNRSASMSMSMSACGPLNVGGVKAFVTLIVFMK